MDTFYWTNRYKKSKMQILLSLHKHCWNLTHWMKAKYPFIPMSIERQASLDVSKVDLSLEESIIDTPSNIPTPTSSSVASIPHPHLHLTN